MLPLKGIARQHVISMHSYANDMQLYISFDDRDLSSISKDVKSSNDLEDLDVEKWIEDE